jgi:DMSO/TMAO reductase YedYZ molybdopterin-dependent catalytic subunit
MVGVFGLWCHRNMGMKAKWVKRVKFTETQELVFWERNGYSNTADPWTKDRYA